MIVAAPRDRTSGECSRSAKGTPMTFRFRWVGLALAAAFVSVPILRGDEPKAFEGDLKKMQGEWVNRVEDHDDQWVFKGHELRLTAPTRKYTMMLTLDPKAKPQSTIDFKIVEGPDEAKGQTTLGIYKFDGDDKLLI